MKYYVTVTTVNARAEKTEYEIDIDGDQRLTVNGAPHAIDFQSLSKDGYTSLLLDSRSVEGLVEEKDYHSYEMLIRGELYSVTVQDERAYRLAKARGTGAHESGEVALQSPMPGIVTRVPVKVGDLVTKQSTLVILESMKMENELRAPREGTIIRVNVTPGQAVEKGYLLVVIGDMSSAAD